MGRFIEEYADTKLPYSEADSNNFLDMNVRFTEEEMRKMNLTSLALKDGSGYVGSFYAYHEIHCVVRTFSTSN